MDQTARRAAVQQALWLGAGLFAAIYRDHRFAATFFCLLFISAVIDRRLLRIGDTVLPTWAFVAILLLFGALGWFFPG